VPAGRLRWREDIEYVGVGSELTVPPTLMSKPPQSKIRSRVDLGTENCRSRTMIVRIVGPVRRERRRPVESTVKALPFRLDFTTPPESGSENDPDTQ